MTKTFDCVEMKRRGALQIHARTGALTHEGKVAFWQERDRELRALIDARRAARPAERPAVAEDAAP